MKKFTVKEIKEKFINDQVSNNLKHVEKRLSENKSLSDTFYDFSQVEGFGLASATQSGTFNFSVLLLPENNSETNNGQIVFSKQDFEEAISEFRKQALTKVKLKKVKSQEE